MVNVINHHLVSRKLSDDTDRHPKFSLNIFLLSYLLNKNLVSCSAMQKQIIRGLARYGKVLHNNTKMKRNFSVTVALQNDKGYTEGQKPFARSYSLAMTAEKTINSEASKCFYYSLVVNLVLFVKNYVI